MRSITSGSIPSSARSPISRADCHTIRRIAIEMSRPTMGSARRNPAATPITPATTARLVMPSMRAW